MLFRSRFPFDKFADASNKLGTQMKATGEVMGIGSTLEECLLKSVRSLEIGVCHFHMPKFDSMGREELLAYVSDFRDDGFFACAQLLRLGESVEKLEEVTGINAYFLTALKHITDFEPKLAAAPYQVETLKEAKVLGFSDRYIAKLWGCTEMEVLKLRRDQGILPVFRMVDTSHVGAYIPCFYSSYTGVSGDIVTEKPKKLVLGAGPIRIGQAWSLTTPRSTRCRPSRRRALRPSSSTTTPRPSPPTTPPPTSCTSSP